MPAVKSRSLNYHQGLVKGLSKPLIGPPLHGLVGRSLHGARILSRGSPLEPDAPFRLTWTSDSGGTRARGFFDQLVLQLDLRLAEYSVNYSGSPV